MTNLTNAVVTDKETNTEYGFAHILFEVDGRGYSIQACCNDDGVINKDDDGMDWGISGEANEEAFKTFGYDEAREFFYKNI